MSLAIAGILDKLERATGPDRKIDMEIFALERGWSFPLFGAAWEEWTAGNREGLKQDYTGSVDAALKLAPQDSAVGLAIYLEDNPDNKEGRYRATIMPPLSMKPAQDVTVYARTLPLAICFAALKSRGDQQATDGKA